MADNIIHETNRYTKTARTSQNPCSKTASGRPWDSRNCSNGRSIPKFCSSMEGCVQKRRTTSSGKQTASVKTLQTIRQAIVKARKDSLKGPKSKWLQNRAMDTTTYSKVNTETFWHKLPYCTRLANPAKAGLELPETREASQRTQRAGHRILAKKGLASYKKKHVEPEKQLYWSMKAVLCLPQPLDAPGRLKDKHPFNIAGTEEIDSRSFLRSAFRRCFTDSACIFLSRTVISRWMILKHLYRCCLYIFQRVLSWCSTVGWFTAGQKEDCVRGSQNVLTLNGCLLMPLILIRSSRSGITASTVNLPTIFLMMYWYLKKPYFNLLSILVHKRFYYVHSSKKPD